MRQQPTLNCEWHKFMVQYFANRLKSNTQFDWPNRIAFGEAMRRAYFTCVTSGSSTKRSVHLAHSICAGFTDTPTTCHSMVWHRINTCRNSRQAECSCNRRTHIQFVEHTGICVIEPRRTRRQTNITSATYIMI